MNGKIVMVFAAAALAAGMSACGGASSPQTLQPAGSVQPVASSSAAAAPSAVTRAPVTVRQSPPRGPVLRVLVEPADGTEPIYQLIAAARSSVDLTMYELDDPAAEAGLAADAARGVDVRVILDQHLERSANTGAYDYLTAQGVHVRWAPADTTYHQKTLTIDNATSVIMTLNLVANDYPDTRDFAVIDTGRADVGAIVATFDADFAGNDITPPQGADLVWSPTNAQASVLSVINGASRTLAVEDEEMDDPAVSDALAAAAQRGVRVDVTMTADPEWDQAFDELTKAGVHVSVYADDSAALYIHAKAIVADAGQPGQKVLTGSQNLSVASLDYNRELGILTTDPAVVAAIAATLSGDYAGGTAYSPAPSPATSPAPSPATGSGTASCSATASVYNASDDENNVYVHSNQPDQEATATAAGYSHSYWTDHTGYALIYLNGPPPGAQITVTVGGATCTTSD